jgi:predicted 2-oxoglutarate/Fe(II)-dependent dioxygenase YbiX
VKISSFLPRSAFVGLELQGAVEPRWCEALRASLAARGYAPTGNRYPGGYRDNDRQVFEDPELATQLYAQVGHALPAALERDGERWELVGLNPRFRACRYRGGQAFCIHRDGAYHAGERTRSLLTLQLYLDDASAMRGGHTRFYADRQGNERWAQVAPRLGTAIVFDHRVWHDGEAVTEGEKQVLRTDVLYRRASGAPTGDRAELDRAGPGPSVEGTRYARRALIGRHRGYAWRAIACRDGSVASCGRDGTVRRWGDRGELACHAVAAGSITALVEDAEGRLWCGSREGAVYRQTSGVATGFALIRGGLGAVLALAALPGGGVVVSTAPGAVVELDTVGRMTARANHQGWAWAVVVVDGAVLSAGEDRGIEGPPGHSARAGRGQVYREQRPLVALERPARALAALADGALLVGGDDGSISRVERAATATSAAMTSVRRWQAHDGAVTALAVAPDGRTWASSSEDGTIKRWREDSLLRASPPRPDFVTSVAFTAAGALLATGYDGEVSWELGDADEPSAELGHAF